MKIAIATDGKNVSGHFGHCEGFTVYEISDGKEVDKIFIPNPGHRPGFLPVYLGEKNVNMIISGGMGATAQQLFNDHNIDVIVGAKGNCDDIIKSYLSGELKSTGSVCREHMHADHCHDA